MHQEREELASRTRGADQGGQEVRPDEQECTDLGVISWDMGFSTLAKTPGDGVNLLLEWSLGAWRV